MYLSGSDISGDIQESLRNFGYQVYREILYHSIIVDEISDQAVESINSLIKIVLLYSPRAALAFSNLVKKYCIDLSDKIAICISDNASKNLDIKQWKGVLISKYSHEDSMIDAIKKLIT